MWEYAIYHSTWDMQFETNNLIVSTEKILMSRKVTDFRL